MQAWKRQDNRRVDRLCVGFFWIDQLPSNGQTSAITPYWGLLGVRPHMLTPARVKLLPTCLLLLVAGCTHTDTPGPANRFSEIAAESLVTHGYCKSRAECEKTAVITTGTFKESSVVNSSLFDWRYETKNGVFVAIHGIKAPGLAEEISNKIGPLLVEHQPCVRISVQAASANRTIPPDQLIYVCPVGGV
jgi:hypothetical protein